MNSSASIANSVATVAEAPSSQRRGCLGLLTWAFMLFNSMRMVAYIPRAWAIYSTGDSSQHSLWTWCTWLGANVTMAAWLHEHNGNRIDKAVLINIGNATMCLVTVLLILHQRF